MSDILKKGKEAPLFSCKGFKSSNLFIC